MFTTEQRDWVTGFMAKGPLAVPPQEDEAEDQGFDEIDILIDQANGGAGTGNGYDEIDILIEQATEGDESKGVNGADLDLADAGSATEMTCTCTFHNGTQELLTVDQASLDIDNGKLTELPDAEVDAGGKTKFAAENTKVWTPIPFLGDVGVFGIEGHIKYTFPDGETTLTLHFDNPRFEKWGKTSAEAILEGPKAGDYTAKGIAGSGNKAAFKFSVHGKGGGGDVPPKPDTPADQATSCLVTVVNQTGLALSLDDQQNETGDFMTNPATTIAPGASAQFAFVGTPHGKTPGCKGSCRYFIGETTDTWAMEWSNPVGEKNAATATATSTTAVYHSLEQIGQGEENVPVTFTLTGGGGGGGQVVPPKPEDDPPFTPPASAKEPTLRKGDKAPDGWVEYLQTALATHGETVQIDGSFGPATLKAVLSFQKKNGLQVDGTVGNQTWAALRDGAGQPPSTDGRAPHSYEEAGEEARFFTERDPVYYSQAKDTLFFSVVSVGDATKLDGRKVTARITAPGAKPRVAQVPLVEDGPVSNTDQGSLWSASLAGMAASYPSTPPGAPGGEYVVEAYLDQDLGGSTWSGKPPSG